MSPDALTVALYAATIVQSASFAAVGLLVATVKALRADVNALREYHTSVRVTLFGETGTNGHNGRISATEHDLAEMQRWRASVDAERRVGERRDGERRAGEDRRGAPP